MNRRELLISAASLAASQILPTTAIAGNGKEASGEQPGSFRLALAGLLRHNHPSEIAPDLARFRTKGYNGIWIENDYLRWKSKAEDPIRGLADVGDYLTFSISPFPKPAVYIKHIFMNLADCARSTICRYGLRSGFLCLT